MRLEVRFFVGLVAVLVTYLVIILGHHGLLFPCKTQIASSITKYSGLKNETNFSLPGTAKLNKRNTDEDMATALNLSSMMSPLCAGDHFYLPRGRSWIPRHLNRANASQPLPPLPYHAKFKPSSKPYTHYPCWSCRHTAAQLRNLGARVQPRKWPGDAARLNFLSFTVLTTVR
jgi:hypothetical protein